MCAYVKQKVFKIKHFSLCAVSYDINKLLCSKTRTDVSGPSIEKVNCAAQLRTSTGPDNNYVEDKRDYRCTIPWDYFPQQNTWSNMYILLFHDSESSYSCVKVCMSETQNYIQFFTCFIYLTLCVLLSNVFIICYTICFIRLVHCISLYFQGAMEFCTVIFSPVLHTYSSKPH